MIVGIKNNVEKDSALLLFFLSKSPAGHAISRQKDLECMWCGQTDKTSWMDGLPNFLRYGATVARASRGALVFAVVE